MAEEVKLTPEEELVEFIGSFWADPMGYVMAVFPWDTDESIQMVELVEPWKSRYPRCKYGPDAWACRFLDEWGAEIKKRNFDGKNPVLPIRFSTSSGHGIGKTTLVAWIIKFIHDTRPFSMGVVTANTGDQLKTKTWAELSKWHKISLTAHWSDYSAARGSMCLKNREHPDKWRVDAMTCKEENKEAFQGLHAANSTPFFVYDEASGIPKPIWDAREGGATDGEPMSFDFGNPTRKTGEFFENCIGKNRHRYIVRQIDSRNVKITNKALIQQWVDDHGEESDFVKVKVRGIFPNASSIQFIATDDVEEAGRRRAVTSVRDPLVIGVDVARFGDDSTVIYPRIGKDARSFPPRSYSGLDTVQVVGKVIEMVREFEAVGKKVSMIFVDGGGIGGGVYDQLFHLGYPVTEVQFGSTKVLDKSYRFVVDEMWGRMRDEIKGRLAIIGPETEIGQQLKDQLTQREFSYTIAGNKVTLESKDDMKKRGINSPDVADALALTCYRDVMEVDPALSGSSRQRHATHEYDPLERA